MRATRTAPTARCLVVAAGVIARVSICGETQAREERDSPSGAWRRLVKPSPVHQASISERSTTALLWGAGGAIAKIAAQLLVQVTLARILDPHTFGEFAILMALVGLSGVVTNCGFGSALIQKSELVASDVGLALGWSMLIALGLAVIISLAAPGIAELFGDPSLVWMLRAIAVALIPLTLANLYSSLLHRELRMKSIQLIHMIAYTIVFGGIATTLALLGWKGWSLVIAYTAQVIFTLAVTFAICRYPLRLQLSGDRRFVHFGLKSLATELTNWSTENADRFLVGRFWGLSPLGLYSVAFNLSKAPAGLMVTAVQNIAFASAARLQDNAAAVRKGFLVVLSAVALVSLPAFTLVALESATVLRVVYGTKWLDAAPYMTALALAIPVISLGTISAAILRGMGSVGAEFRVQFVTATAFLGGFVILSTRSLALAVWIVPLAYLCRLTWLLILLRKRLGLGIAEILATFRGALVLTAVGVGVATMARLLPGATSLGMGTLPIVCASLAIASLLVAGFPWLLGDPLTAIVRARLSEGRLGPFVVWLTSRGTR